MELLDIIKKIEGTFLLKDACDWDFVGWQVRAANQHLEINEVLIALDVTNDVIEQAIREDIKLIICHHPFIFAKNLNDDAISATKKALYQKLIDHQINVYVLHTNFDKNPNGMNWLMAQGLQLHQIKYFAQDRLAVIGQYHNLTLVQVITLVKKYFGFKQVKVITNDLQANINNVMLSAGAGGSVIELITNKDNISLVITGEIKWHQELEARDKNISVLVVGHDMEEKFVTFISNFLLSDSLIKKSVTIKQHYFPKAVVI